VFLGCSDSGTRHHSRFWNDEYLAKEGIPVRHDIDVILNTGDDQPDYSS
jgi:hypothetical protein